jgi:hypothetical protein
MTTGLQSTLSPHKALTPMVDRSAANAKKLWRASVHPVR